VSGVPTPIKARYGIQVLDTGNRTVAVLIPDKNATSSTSLGCSRQPGIVGRAVLVRDLQPALHWPSHEASWP